MKVGFFEFLLPYGVNYLFSRLNSDGERVRRIIFDSLHDCVRNLDLEEGTLSLAQATFSKSLLLTNLQVHAASQTLRQLSVSYA